MQYTIYNGDCLEELKKLPDNSVDSVVTDPPYGLSKEPDMEEVLRHWLAGDDYKHNSAGFMGKKWDSFVPGPAIWKEVLRVLKPGGHMLAFFGSRTYDMGVLAIRLAGFEVRDQIMWVYLTGFPKSLDVSKQLDRIAGAEREVIRQCKRTGKEAGTYGAMAGNNLITAPATPEAQQWQGWGTALKPAHEPIVMARKPFKCTVAQNVLEHGTGALNIDGCRIETTENLNGGAYAKNGSERTDEWGAHNGFRRNQGIEFQQPLGRWPANFIHDGSDQVLNLFPESKGQQGDVKGTEKSRTGGEGTNCYGEYDRIPSQKRGDSGSAARFFYCAKTSKKDRDEGLDGFETRKAGSLNMRTDNHSELNGMTTSPQKNDHPTVKPTSLMQYLCRLITPPNGTILDPFMGSGSTGKAAMHEGFNFIGMELDEHYCDIAKARIEFAINSKEKTENKPTKIFNDLFEEEEK